MKLTARDVQTISAAMQRAIAESPGHKVEAVYAASLATTTQVIIARVAAELDRRDARMRSLASRITKLEQR